MGKKPELQNVSEIEEGLNGFFSDKQIKELETNVNNRYKGLENGNKMPMLEYSNVPIPSYFKGQFDNLNRSDRPIQITGSEIIINSSSPYNYSDPDYIKFDKELVDAIVKEPEKKKPIRKLVLD